ncbi:flagellar basal body-associated FliL family protein [Tibeticola sediminis]|nr:flagellar basal body-associated FliL family protein [Tibeticola sediminis]
MLFIIVGAVLVLALGGGGAWWFLLRPKAAPDAAHAPAPAKVEKEAKFIALEPFVTNVQSNDGITHYLQVKIELKVYDPKLEERIKATTPEIRSTILRILAAQQADKVSSVEVRDALAAEILSAVNAILTGRKPGSGHGEAAEEGPVAGVFFTAFVVQ